MFIDDNSNIPPPPLPQTEYVFGEEDSPSTIKYKEENGEQVISGGIIEKIIEKIVPDPTCIYLSYFAFILFILFCFILFYFLFDWFHFIFNNSIF